MEGLGDAMGKWRRLRCNREVRGWEWSIERSLVIDIVEWGSGIGDWSERSFGTVTCGEVVHWHVPLEVHDAMIAMQEI